MMKLQGVECVLAGLLGALFVVNVQGYHKPERQLCEAFGEPCISYDVNSPIGPRCWFKIDFPREKCCNENGKLQSPIDIPEVKRIFKAPKKLRYSSDEFSGNFENTGIQPGFKREGDDKVFLEGIGSPKGKRYFIENVHFHVGVKGKKRQTEHLLNGKSFDGEAHIVHVREDFGTVRKAAAHPKGLLVIAIFLTTSETKKGRSDAFDELIKMVPHIREFDAENGPCANVDVDELEKFKKVVGMHKRLQFCRKSFAEHMDTSRSVDNCNFYLPNGKCGDKTEETINPNELLAHVPEYYIYQGSLTTPPCSESVVWVIAKKPREVTSFYPFVVRSLETQIEGETIGKFGNLRPLQDLEGRKVFLVKFGYRYWWKHHDMKDASDADGDHGPFKAMGLH